MLHLEFERELYKSARNFGQSQQACDSREDFDDHVKLHCHFYTAGFAAYLTLTLTMDTVEPHSHSLEPGEWPFTEPENAAVFTTSRAVRGGEPILLVSHDHEGDWQFLCGDVTKVEECMLVCLACAYIRDRSVGVLADLPTGWQARRESVDSPWERYSVEDEDDES